VQKQWDRLIKMLMQANPQDLVSWVLTDAIYESELNLELLKKAPIFADLLYTITWRGETVVLHVEFQREQDDEMGRRVWEYNCLTSIHTGLPVYSVVVYLLEDSPIVDPPYEIKLPTGFTVHRFLFQNIKLWEIPGEVLKQQKLPGLLPLLPLTQDGKRREVVEEMIQGLQQADKIDLLPIAYIFSAYTFIGENEQQWLTERFHIMKDFLEGNYAYQEMVKWAEEKSLKQGLEQGTQKMLQSLRTTSLRFVETHFPDQLSLAKQQVELITTPLQVQEMLDKLFVAHTDDEVKKILLDFPQ
jgi:predicted transposase/invertase (TIGR01784 family)